MADTFTTSLELRIQTIGGNNNSWGGFLNTDLGYIDTAIGGALSVSLASANVTLTAAQNRNPVVVCTGTIPANRELIVKTQTKHFWVHNNTAGAFTVTVKTAAGTGVVVPQGQWAKVYCDGTNVEEIAQLGNLASLDQVAAGQIASDAVTTAKILDSNVTLAKLANIAAATILGNNTGGATAPIALTAAQTAAVLPAMVGDSGSGGTKGLVLAPAAGDATEGKVKVLGAGGAFIRPTWHYISEHLLSSGASYDITGLSAYDLLKITLTYYPNIDAYPRLQFGTSGGGVDTGNNYAYAVEYDRWAASGTDSSRSNALATSSIILSATETNSDIDADTSGGFVAEILVSRFNDEAETMLTWRFFGKCAADGFIQGTGGGLHLTSSALDRIRFLANTGTFIAGTSIIIEGRVLG